MVQIVVKIAVSSKLIECNIDCIEDCSIDCFVDCSVDSSMDCLIDFSIENKYNVLKGGFILFCSQCKVNLTALSNDSRIDDSNLSNTLLVGHGASGGGGIQSGTGFEPISGQDDDFVAMSDENELVLKVVRVSDSTIHLDWSQYRGMSGILYYRVVWSSVAQPAVCCLNKPT